MITEQKYNFSQIKSGDRKVALTTKRSATGSDKKIYNGEGTMSDADFNTFIQKLNEN